MTMTKFFLILGVASITYGFARWQILTEVSTKQNAYFEGFFAVHSDDSTARVTKQEVGQLRKQVMLSGGMHHGWAQAVIPVTFGLMFLATGYFFLNKKESPALNPSAPKKRTRQRGSHARCARQGPNFNGA